MLADLEITWKHSQAPDLGHCVEDDCGLISRASAPDGLTVVIIGALYYRDAAPELQQCPFADAEYALAIYRSQGAAGLERLEGEFTLILWDPKIQSLFAMRDPLGSWPVYWVQSGNSVRLATSLQTLSRGIPTRINETSLGRFLVQPFTFTELDGEETMIDPIRRLQAGCRLTIDRDHRIRLSHYWDWNLVFSRPAPARTLDEAAEQFAELFRRAVVERTRRGNIAAHLSGGMDSSSVFCLAREALTSRNRCLTAISGIYDMPGIAFEKEYIDLVLQQGGNVDCRRVQGDAALDYDWFGERPLPDHDEPYAALFRIASERSLIDAAHDARASVVLTGAAADDLLGSDRFRVAELVRRGRFLAAWREIERKSQGKTGNLWTTLGREGLERLLPAGLQDGLGVWLRGGFGSWPRLGHYALSPWIRRDFATRHHLWDNVRNACREANRFPYEKSFRSYLLRTTSGDFSSWYLGAPRGIRNSHPFLDLRIIRFAVNLPAELRDVPGRMKPVLAEAMRGVLPEPVRTRRVKGHFNDVFWNGFARSLPQLEEMVQNSRIHELGLFETGELIRAMRQHALGIGNARVGGRINSTLALIAWYDQWQARRSTAPSADAASRSTGVC